MFFSVVSYCSLTVVLDLTADIYTGFEVPSTGSDTYALPGWEKSPSAHNVYFSVAIFLTLTR